MLNAPPARMTSRLQKYCFFSYAGGGGPIRIGSVEVLPLEAFDADGALLLVEDHARGEVVHPDGQPVGMFLLHGSG